VIKRPFLTPTGRESTTDEGVEYVRLSYQREIGPWLRYTAPSVKAPAVQELVQQYLTVIETL
jgi:hypothetical protein